MSRPTFLPFGSASHDINNVQISAPFPSDSTVYEEDKKSSYDPTGKSALPGGYYTPRRKYSKEWFSHSWDKKVVRKTLPRTIYIGTGMALMVIWVVVMFVFAQKTTKLQRSNANSNSDDFIKKNSDFDLEDIIALQCDLRQFDTSSRTLTVQWSGLVFNDDNVTEPMGLTPNTSAPLGFYRDVKGIYDQNATTFWQDTISYSVDNTTAPRIGVIGQHPWDSVETDIDMGPADDDDVWKQPLFGYPWDQWTGDITILLTQLAWEDLDQGGMGAPGLGSVFIPASVSLTGDVLNWKIKQNPVVSTTCDNQTLIATDPGNVSCEMTVTFSATRPGLVIFVVIIVVIVNWLSTIAIFLFTGEAVLLRRQHILSDTDILAMCFAALFALPTVRTLLPGAPDFGAVIDLIGILPNVIIISLCTTVFALQKIRMRRQQDDSAKSA